MGLFAKARQMISISSALSLARVAGALAGFATQVLLARMLHASSLGLFYSVTSLAAVVGLAATHGFPAIAPRFISRYREKGKPALLAAFVHQARRESAFVVVLAMVCVIGFAWAWPSLDMEARAALLAAAFAIPANAALRVNGSTAGAIRRFALAFLPDTCIRPFMLLFGVVILLSLKVPLTAVDVTWLLTGIFTVLAFVQYSILKPALPPADGPVPRRLKRVWRREALPLILVVLFTSFFSDVAILIVTPLLPRADTGALGICLKLALLVGFAVQVAQQVVVPDLADAHAQKSYAPISEAMFKALGFPLVVTVSAMVVLGFWGKSLLALFGSDFVYAKTALLILVSSQLVRALAGPNVALLTVIGAQQQNALLAILSLGVLMLGNAVLAPAFGITGAAVAVLIAVIFWMGSSAYVLHRLSGLRTDALYLAAGAWLRRKAKTS